MAVGGRASSLGTDEAWEGAGKLCVWRAAARGGGGTISLTQRRRKELREQTSLESCGKRRGLFLGPGPVV